MELSNDSPLEPLRNADAAAAPPIKINSVVNQEFGGRLWVIKRRTAISIKITKLANFFFRLARIPIRFCSDPKDWQQTEISSYRMLNGDRFRAFPLGTAGVCAARIPGRSLWSHMKRGTLNSRMLKAAASEFRRAHQIWSDQYGDLWSHGDATMSNVLYDKSLDRARLIDFEIVHDKSLPASARRADDLHVFLLDLASGASNRKWLPFALCFLDAYGLQNVIEELQKNMVIPVGIARIWWKVRTNFVSTRKVKKRLDQLRHSIEARNDVKPVMLSESDAYAIDGDLQDTPTQ